tara:strand:+ start:572 stop:751 length:180 start_codon:yes stop_codon:yes gene_type:complete
MTSPTGTIERNFLKVMGSGIPTGAEADDESATGTKAIETRIEAKAKRVNSEALAKPIAY